MTKGPFIFAGRPTFWPPCTQTESTRELLASLLSRDANFSSHPPWTGGDYKKSRNTRFHLPSRHSSVHPSERARVYVCVCVATLCTGNRGSPFFSFSFFLSKATEIFLRPASPLKYLNYGDAF